MDTHQSINAYLTFILGEESFATNVTCVVNIMEMTKITKVPQAPPYMKGVINFQGQVLPLIDTKVKFGMDQAGTTPNTCIMIVKFDQEGESIFIGALVDAVQEVIELTTEDIQPPPSYITDNENPNMIEGMVEKNNAFILILNMKEIFSARDIIDMQTITKKVKNKGKATKAKANEKTGQ